MSELYTCGTWTVVPGREEEFVAAWSEFANWTTANIPGAGWAKLLQSEETPNRFVSVGPWESADAAEAWRESDSFRERAGRIRDMLEAFEPGAFDSRVDIAES